MAGHLSSGLATPVLTLRPGGICRSGFFLVFLLLVACDKPFTVPKQRTNYIDNAMANLALLQLSKLVQRQSETTIAEAKNLKQASHVFLESPTSETQKSFQQAWLSAHGAYLANQLGLFSDLSHNADLLFSLDAWPILPGFLDSLPDYPSNGLINDVTINITAATLRHQHGITDHEEVCLGYHAIEYLIFNRPITDFIVKETSDPVNQSIIRRRHALDIIVTELNLDLQKTTIALTEQFDPPLSTTPQHELFRLLDSIQHNLQSAFRASNFFVDDSYSHGVFSKSSSQSLIIELNALEEFTLGAVSLTTIFETLDTATASNYQITLRKAIELVNDVDATEIEKAKLPLMLSALLHQLVRFQDVLRQQL